MKLLVVHSDDDVLKILVAQLADRGLGLHVASGVVEAREAITRQTFDVAIVDLSLDDGSGSVVVEAIREQGSTTHILVLSGSAHDSDRREALAVGADDFFVKPVIASELTARVLAIGRRFRSDADATLRVHHVEIDLTARVVTAHGKSVRLTMVEFDLLVFLATRPELIFSRDELLQAVWNTSDARQPSVVARTVARLRSKIEIDPKHPRILCTVRGAGYCFEIPPAGARQGRVQPAQIPGTLVDVEGVIVSADAAAVAMMGYQREEELLGQHFFDLMAPSSREAIRERLRVVSQGGSPRSQVFDLRRTDGVELTVALRSSACEWQGRPARTKTVTPITDPSARLRYLVTGVFGELADAVIVTDLHFHVRSWNSAAHRLYGWSEQEAIGRHLLDVVPWANDTDRLSSTWQSLEATGRWYGVGRQVTRTGTEIAVYASTTLVRDELGEPMGVVSVNRRAESAAGSNLSRSTTTDAEIREGIDNDQFVVHYQPVVDLEDKQIVSFEALVRWNHPQFGLLNPSAFIDVAEQSSLIVELGALVLDNACRQTVEWQRQGADVAIAVNISGRELADPSFVARVGDTLAAAGLDPRSLWLEVTETVLVEELDQVRLRLARLAETGIGIVIDDFGTGWASLLYLRQFPVRALKIDRVFVSGVDRKANDTAIARSILSLGADLDLVVVAEGVETIAQERRLRKLGCRFAQGYLYGRPTPATAAPMQQCRKYGASTAGVVSEDSMIDAQVPVVFDTATQGVVVATGASGRRANSQAPPGDGGSGASTSTLTPVAPIGSAVTGDSPDATMLRGLLRIRTTEQAARLLQNAAVALGGSLTPAADAGADALPLDLSLGEGPPLLVEADPMSVARVQLEQFLPRLAEDARQAVHLLRHNERLEDASTTDRLTGLANRRVLDRVLPRATDGVVIFIDLDHFKQVNDTAGHDVGDAVLAAFGQVLNREVRASDTCCRLGGEEFVIVTAGATISDARDLTVRLRTAWLEAAPLPVTFSAGVAAIGDAGGAAALAAADQALYRAKASGRNRTEFEFVSASDL